MRLILSIFLIACFLVLPAAVFSQHYYYIPNSSQIPMFKQRHDGDFGFGWAHMGAYAGLELQASYSPLKQIALTAGYLNLGDRDVLKNQKEGLKYRFYEVGAGLYEVLPRGTATLLAGVGKGNAYNYFFGNEKADLDILRWFIQPSILYRDAFFQGGMCLRLSFINFTYGKVGIAIPAYELEAVKNVEKKAPFFLPEIGLNGGLRYQAVFFGINVCGIFPRTDNLSFVRLTSSIFIKAEFGKWIRGKKKTATTS